MKKAAKRKIVFIVALLLVIFCHRPFAQKLTGREQQQSLANLAVRADPIISISMPSTFFPLTGAGFQPAASLLFTAKGPGILPEDFYTRNLGLMCRMEWRFEKTTHLPLKFRLGSLEYCNWLEGKK